MPRRITYVLHQFLPRWFTGTERYASALARELRRRGDDVDVFTLEPDFAEHDRLFDETHDEVDGLPVTRVRPWYALDRDHERMEYAHPFLAERFRRHLEVRRPDVVHVFHLRYLGVDLLAEARACGMPTVVHLMDFWFLCPAVVLRRGDGTLCDGPPDGGLGCIDCLRPGLAADLDRDGLRGAVRELGAVAPSGSRPGRGRVDRAATLTERPARLREALLQADRIIAPSFFLREVFERNGYPAGRIDTIGYGVDPARIGPRRAPRAPERGKLRCAFVGSIAEHKGTDVAVDAVRRAGAGVTLDVHGRTTDFPAYSAPLVARAAEDPRIRFRGPFTGRGLGAALAAADVLLVPSRWYENTPFVVLEAFAAGVPVIAADLGGLRELVADGRNGERFRPGDAADLAFRLDRLAGDPERLSRYRAAIPPVKTLADHATEIADLYAGLVAGRRG